MTIEHLFFELLRVAIGTQDRLSRPPSAEEWKLLYDMAKKQSVVGICFAAVQSIRQAQKTDEEDHRTSRTFEQLNLPEVDYLQWMGMAAKIQQRNEVVTRDVARGREHFEAQGMDIVLLKGQGNLCNYPENLRGLRTSGDIDVWVMPKGFENMPVKERMKNDEWFLRWLWKKDKSIRHCYIHVIYPQITESEVEVHFRPSYLNSPIRNRRFQMWMMEEAPKQVAHRVLLPTKSDGKAVEVAVPTEEFNIIYQLSHLYRHIFDDGLGLRQVLDYYFVLKSALQENKKDCGEKVALTKTEKTATVSAEPINETLANDCSTEIVSELPSSVNQSYATFSGNADTSAKSMKNICETLKRFGMYRFAQALMYVLQSHLGLEKKYLLCEPNSETGAFLLEEIMMAGNFGHYDEREKRTKHENGVQRLLRRQKRNMRFFGQYAEEVACVPIYRIYQEWWRLKMNFKCK